MPLGTQAYQVEELLEHSEWVRRLAISLVGCESTADDLVQETFLTALEHPPEKRGAAQGWLARVMRNLVIDRSRRRSRRKVREEKVVEGTPHSSDELAPGNIQARLEMQELLAQVVKDLAEPYRTTTVLYYFDDLTSDQVAKKLGINSSTVRNQLSRARGKIRERMQARYGKDWKAMCIGLLLKPTGVWQTPLETGTGISWIPAASLTALLAIAGWAWKSNVQDAEQMELSAESNPSGSSLFLADANLPHSTDEVGRRAIQGKGHSGNLHIFVKDLQGHSLPGVTCRVYAVRRQMDPMDLIGPEAIQFDAVPILSRGVTDEDGILKLEIPFRSELAIESQLGVVVEKAGFTKCANLIWPSGKNPDEILQANFRLELGVPLIIKVLDESLIPIKDARLMPRLLDPNPSDERFQSFFATTDDEGIASFQALHPMVRELKCWSPGYLSKTLPILPQQLKSDQPLTIVLARGGQAEVRVYSGGDPYQDARVFLTQGRRPSSMHGAKVDPGYLGETDESGYLRVSGIDSSRAAHLIVKVGGMEKRVQMMADGGSYQVHFPKFAYVSGQAFLADGTPAARALVLVVDPAKLSVSHTSTCWTKEDGSFEIPVLPSLFAIGVFHPSGTRIYTDVFSSKSGSVDFSEIHLPKGNQVTLRLLDEASEPILGKGNVSIIRHPEVAIGRFGEPRLLMKYMVMGLQSVLPFRGERGEFVFKNLPEGEVFMGVDIPGYQHQVIAVDVSSDEQIIDVVVKKGVQASLRLIDVNGNAAVGIPVELVPDDYPWNWKRQQSPKRPERRHHNAVSDADGHIKFSGLPPGTWELALPGRAQFGMILKSFAIKENAEFGAVILQPMGIFSLAASSPEGALSACKVTIADLFGVNDISRQPWKVNELTDHLGHMEPLTLPAGSYQVRLFARNTLPRFESIAVDPQSHTPLHMRLSGAEINGSLPAGTEDGQVVLLQKNSKAEAQSKDWIQRMRKILRQPAYPNHGGAFRVPFENNAVPFLYATSRVQKDGGFTFHTMPDGDYWLFGTGQGYRICGPIDLQIRNGEMTFCSVGPDVAISLQPGAGIHIVVPELVAFLTRNPQGRLTATINAGPPTDWVSSEEEAPTWVKENIELLPRGEVVFEISKDRPREYQIEYTLIDGRGNQYQWSSKVRTQLGSLQIMTVSLP